MRFRATIRLEGKTATGIPVPTDIVGRLGKGKRPRVRVTLGGHTYRSTVAAYGDVFVLPSAGRTAKPLASRRATRSMSMSSSTPSHGRSRSPPTSRIRSPPIPTLSGSSRGSRTAGSAGMCCRSMGQSPPKRGSVASTSRWRCCGGPCALSPR